MSEENTEVDETEQEETTEGVEATEEQQEESKTFTQDEVEGIVKQRLARAEKQKEQAVKEAEKLAKMNEAEKQQYEFEKTQQELEEMKRQINYFELSKVATNILSENGIVANDDILQLVVKDNAETTNDSVVAFTNMVSDLVDKQVKEKLRGQAPKRAQQSSGITKQDVLNMSYTDQLKFKQENQETYNKLFN